MNMGYIHHNSENKIFLPIYGYVVYLFIIFALDISQYHRAFDRFARQSSQPSHFLGCKLGRESVEQDGLREVFLFPLLRLGRGRWIDVLEF